MEGGEKKKKLDKRAVPMVAAAAALVAAGVVVFNLPDAPSDDGPSAGGPLAGGPSAPELPVSSGPVTVMQYGHRLGDTVFISVGGLRPGETGSFGVFTPDGELYREYKYDGSLKQGFNQYFMPDTSSRHGLCTAGDLVGVWTVAFAGGAYRPVQFAVADEWVPGSKDIINDEC